MSQCREVNQLTQVAPRSQHDEGPGRPKFSILVAAFNAEGTIRRCIDSIAVARKGHDVELIVVDDGSTDRTSEVCADHARDLPWIRLIVQLNAGVAEVRNRLLREAKGTYVAFVDGDDFIEPQYFDLIDEKLSQTGADMVVFGHNRLQLDGQVLPRQNKRADLRSEDIARLQLRVAENARIYMLCWARMFRKTLTAGFVFDRRILLGEDTAFNIHIMNRASRVVVVPDALYNHLESPGSISSASYKAALLDSFEAHYRARIRVHSWPQAGTSDHAALKQSIALSYVEYVLLYLLNNILHLPLSEQLRELKRIRNSAIYRQCIPDYAGRSRYSGVRRLVGSFVREQYLLTFFWLWFGAGVRRLRAHGAARRTQMSAGVPGLLEKGK